jgi:hypothetical protein
MQVELFNSTCPSIKELHKLYIECYDKEFISSGYQVDRELSLSLLEDLESFLSAVYKKGFDAGRIINT